MENIKKVAILGLGYVGLPLAIAIEECGKYELIGFDINSRAVDKINNGESPFYDELVTEKFQNLKISATNNPDDIADSDVFIITVPTPILADYEPDLGPVKSASATVAKYLEKNNIVVLESTINPGVCEEVVEPLIREKTGLKGGQDYTLAHCPERVNPGDPKWNVFNIARNIGTISPDNTKKVADFYRSFLNAQVNEVSSIKVAEASKIVENTFRDINIAYVNELAKSFDKLGIDVYETINAASNKPFGFMPHWPGCGVGGHCIAVDPYYLIKRASQSGFNHEFLKLAREINNSMPEYTVDILIKALNKHKTSVNGSKILLYGMSYKPNVGDLRESPALEIKEILEDMGANLLVFDPYLPDYSNVESLELALKQVDFVLVATAHDEIKRLDLEDLKRQGIKIVVDGRNCLDKEQISKLGIDYFGIGRNNSYK